MTTGPAPAFGAFAIDELGTTVTAAAIIDPGLIDSIRDAEMRHALLDILVRLRTTGGLSRREVARRIGCSPATVARFESEDSDPPLSLLQRYARAVGAQLRLSLRDPSAPIEATGPGAEPAGRRRGEESGIHRFGAVGFGRALPSERDAVLPGLERLSRREYEVVKLLLHGDRVPVIARQLFVSQSTVRNHLFSVFRKLRVRSQQELIVLLREPARPTCRVRPIPSGPGDRARVTERGEPDRGRAERGAGRRRHPGPIGDSRG